MFTEFSQLYDSFNQSWNKLLLFLSIQRINNIYAGIRNRYNKGEKSDDSSLFDVSLMF